MPLDSIAAVAARLEDLIALTRRAKSRLAYFAVLYRHTTTRIAADIAAGDFDDGQRLERMATTFAARYFNAYDRFRAGDHPGHAWKVAFDAAESCKPTVLEHLLLGINVHINYDLGPAAFAAATIPTDPATSPPLAPRDALAAARPDFDRINDVMAEVAALMQQRLNRIAPTLAVLDWAGGQNDERLITTAIADARENAWRVADSLSRVSPADQATLERNLDADVAETGRRLLRPSLLGPLLCAIRATQRPDVPGIIDILNAD